MIENTALERLTKLTDVWTPRLVIAVIMAAFVLSYMALFVLAQQAGYPWGLAWLWPLVMDGVIIITSLSLVKRQMRGDKTGYVWFLLILFDGVSIFLNGSAGYTGNTLMGWSFALIHALPPLTMVLTLKLLTNEVKDDGRHAVAIQTLSEVTNRIDKSRTHVAALGDDIASLEAKKADLESQVKTLQKERQTAKKASFPTQFGQATLDKGLSILIDAIQAEGDISGAEFGRRVGISGRKGLDLKKELWDRAALAANGHNTNGHGGES